MKKTLVHSQMTPQDINPSGRRLHAVRIDELAAREGAEHRGGRFWIKHLPFSDDGFGHHLWWSIGTIADGFYSPRHRHNFDQVRLMLKGETHFEGWLLKQGDCGYFPESVPYGPQEQHGGDGLVLTLQLPGPSEQYYPLPNEVNFASAALRERDPLFGRGGRARNIRGEEVDSFEAIWESVKGERICYAEPSCSDIVIMPRSAAHLIAVTRPFSILQRGRFEPHDLEILTIQASGASELGFDPASRGELWFLNRGDIRMGAESYGAFSAFQLLPGARPIPIHASMDTEFFVIRLPFRSGIPKDAEVLPSPVGEVPVNSGTHASVLRY